jgi:hypothetical protein
MIKKICILLLITGPLIANSITHYTDTDPTLLIRKSYGERQIKGKKIIKIDATSGTNYYVFTAPKIATVIRLPYPIKEIINPGKDEVSDTIKQIGEDYFVLTSLSNEFKKGPNIHVICDGGFTLILETIIDDPSVANQLIEFQDKTKIKQSQSLVLKKELATLKKELTLKTNLLHTLLFFNEVDIPFRQSISIPETGDTLSVISCKKIRNTKTRGERLILSVRKETKWTEKELKSSHLEVIPFSDHIITEVKHKTLIYKPKEITTTSEYECLFVFDINSPGDSYYLTLSINSWLRLTERIDEKETASSIYKGPSCSHIL